MPLDVPQLETGFQDLVDEAKRRIEQLRKEWTDHNVSDPGITLIELFAYMTEHYVYQLNRVPEKNYIAFLNLLGASRKPPRAARGSVTFTLTHSLKSDNSEKPVLIRAGTEVATQLSTTQDAIVFTTDRDALVLLPALAATLTSQSSALAGARSWASDAAFVLGFEQDLSAHTLAVKFECDQNDWSCDWQVYRGPPDYLDTGWDGVDSKNVLTNSEDMLVNRSLAGLTKDGEIELYLPNNCKETKLAGIEAKTWVRCVPDKKNSPVFTRVSTETIGITVPVTHAQVIENEVITKVGDGFPLQHHPILEPSDLDELDGTSPQKDEWVVDVKSDSEQWTRVEHFSPAVEPNAKVYMVDPIEGSIQFAPFRQYPDGRQMVGDKPGPGATIRIRRYRIGGGKQGNVDHGQISVVKRSLPEIRSVTNRFRTWGGRDAETLKDVRLRVAAPARERERLRAVTAEDFEKLAEDVPGIGRAHCLADLTQGKVTLLVIPDLGNEKDTLDTYIPKGRRSNEQILDLARRALEVPGETRDRLQAALRPRLLVGISLFIAEPEYDWVTVEVSVSPSSVIAEVERALYHFFHPVYGGPDRKGWRIGQTVREDQIWRLIGNTRGIEQINAIQFWRFVKDKANGTWGKEQLVKGERPIGVLSHYPTGIIVGGKHTVIDKKQ